MRLLADLEKRPPTVDTGVWTPPQGGGLSGLWPTPKEALEGFEPLDTKRFCLVAVTVFDLDDYIEDVCDQRSDPKGWKQHHFSRIAEMKERDGWKFLGYDVANSWLQGNFVRGFQVEMFQSYDEAESYRVKREDHEDMEIFVFGVYRRM